MAVLRFSALALIFLATTMEAQAQPKKGQRRDGDLKEGGPAADFTLKDADGKNPVTLSKLKGKPVVLIFGSCT